MKPFQKAHFSPAAGDPVYRIEQLTKNYQDRRILEIPSLDIFKGEIFALVGPSGAGKSTLLRLLNFLETPTAGKISYFGVPYTPGQEMPLELRRRVTTVFQRPMLLNRSIWDNVAYGLRLRGQHNARASIEGALEAVGLAHLAKQGARSLSGGEAQRVALARAIVLEPEVLLLDEPTANLDPANVNLIETIARRLNQETGTTLVLVTHNIFQARRLAHRVGFLLEGKIIEVNPTGRFFESPDDARTAAFVKGEMVY